MPNKKITALTALTGTNTDVLDVYPIVDVSAPETKKQTRAELFQNIPASSFVAANVWNDAGADVDQRMEGQGDANLFFLDASTARIGIGTATPSAKLHVNGSVAISSPSTTTTAYTVQATDYMIISNRGAANTITLPAAASFPGRILRIMTRTAFAVNSDASNVVGRAGGAASTAIVNAAVGAWSEIQSDGTNWLIIAGGTIAV